MQNFDTYEVIGLLELFLTKNQGEKKEMRLPLKSCLAFACVVLWAVVPTMSQVANSASFEDKVAVQSIAVIFTNPAMHKSASPQNTTVIFTDRRGNVHQGEIFFSVPSQTNVYVRDNVATGPAQVEVRSGPGEVTITEITLAWIAPGLFAANANGQGVPAAVLVRVFPGGGQTYLPLFALSAQSGKYIPIPIEVRTTDKVFLILFGTGISNNPNLEDVKVFVGGASVPVYYAGPQGPANMPGTFKGLDQINALLPPTLPSGALTVYAIVGKIKTNELTIQIK